MAQEINLGGTIYISSKRAAEITGYTQDYIGQLARGGHIAAQRVSGLWYVVEESLRGYKEKADTFKPVPPRPVQSTDLDSTISFDGRDYVSAQRAAAITGYHQDYVGQLARSGKILSRQVGNRWFVDREQLVEHKKHNDALLAAVQTESVGLLKDVPAIEQVQETELHFSYAAETLETSSVIPVAELENEKVTSPELPTETSHDTDIADTISSQDHVESVEEEVREIPIRIIDEEEVSESARPEARTKGTALLLSAQAGALYRTLFALSIGGMIIAGVYFLILPQTQPVGMQSAAVAQSASFDVSRILEKLRDLFGSELSYRRPAR